MGLNGSGKTTLLKLISGFLKPSSGEIFLENRSMKIFSPKILAQYFTYVPQDFPTLFPYTVFEFVLMGRFPWQQGLFTTAEDKEKTKMILETLNLTPLKQRFIAELSGGERQRVLMARALNQDTPFVLLDEPLNHLDIKNSLFVMDLMNRLHGESKKNIIAVMHDFTQVKTYFDDVIFLKNGEIDFFGKVRDAFVPNQIKKTFDVTLHL